MDPVSVVLIVSVIASLLMSTGSTSWRGALSGLNTSLRSKINDLMSDINAGIKSKRLSVSKLLSLLSSKNQAALNSYLLSNPAIAKTLAEVNADSAIIADLSSEHAALEAAVTALQNELLSLGYAQSHGGSKKDEKKYTEIKGKLGEAQKEYSELEGRIRATDLSTNKSIAPDTSHLDAISQNLEGGYNPNGL